MLTVMLAALSLLAEATPPAAAPPPAAPAAAKAPAKSSGGDVICRKEAQLGTNIPAKVCYSKSEYEANKSESRQTLEHMQTNLQVRGN